jgi:LysR family hydrogen peroxide-inducible transcriptional activator
MTFREMEYFVAVAETGHFGRAAERCHASQSALSLQLQKLEAELGVQLIERTNRRVVVTPIGRTLVEKAKTLLQLRQEFLEEAGLEQGPLPRRYRIGFIPTVAPYLLPAVVSALAQQGPGITAQYQEDLTQNLIPRVAQGELDAALVATPVTDSLLEETPLWEDPLRLVVPAGHRLAGRKWVKLADFAEETLLLLQDGHCLSEQSVAVCRAQSGPGQHQALATSIELLRLLVRTGQGVALIPELALNASAMDPGLRSLSVQPCPHRQLRIVTRKTSRMGRQLARLLSGIQAPIPASDR